MLCYSVLCVLTIPPYWLTSILCLWVCDMSQVWLFGYCDIMKDKFMNFAEMLNGLKCATCSEKLKISNTNIKKNLIIRAPTGMSRPNTVREKYSWQEFLAARKRDRVTSHSQHMKFMGSSDVPLCVYWDYICIAPFFCSLFSEPRKQRLAFKFSIFFLETGSGGRGRPIPTGMSKRR